jgi:glycosyltransferase involved in cell wall biosynthesis
MRVAITHDYLTQYGGAEKVLEALATIWPDADIFTTFYDRARLAKFGLRIPESRIHALVPTWLPHSGPARKAWTFAYPVCWRSLDLRTYDLVISSTSYAAHHVQVRPDAKHVCYCHTPPRFLYGLTTELPHDRMRRYVPFLPRVYDRLRQLDVEAASRVTCFVANSKEVQQRIHRFYGRDSTVIYPPVETAAFGPATAQERQATREYFLAFGRLVGSKRVDLVIEAANLAGVPLVVQGTGPWERRLRKMAGQTVRFAGWLPQPDLRDLVQNAAAMVFAAEEDFGIVLVEAMAAGTPVIAYESGGARESVVAGVTGEFFSPQDATALAGILRTFDSTRYSVQACVARAAQFDAHHFEEQITQLVAGVLQEHRRY